ncbi:MAG: hypothetical protein ABIK09_07535 [Pseudomonadota bacterium]
MDRRLLIGGAVGACIAAAIILVLTLGADPTGQATGSKVRKSDKDTVKQTVWNELASHEDTYLTAYADYFQEGDTDALELLSAFNELAFQVTGEGGLWRDTVPNKYFGCQANDDFEICVELRRAEETFAKWDAFQRQASELDSGFQATKFIVRHGDEMREYLRTFVPANESLSAVQNTPFFAQNFAHSIAGM